MDDTGRTDQPDLPEEVGPPDHTRSTAWVSLAAVLVAVVIGRWVSTGFLEWRDRGSVFEPDSAAVGLLAYLVLAAIVLPPVALAVRSGQQARRAGHRDAVVVVAVAVAVAVVVLLGLPVLLSHIVGWPLVVASILGVLGVGWLTQRFGWGHVGRSGTVRSG